MEALFFLAKKIILKILNLFRLIINKGLTNIPMFIKVIKNRTYTVLNGIKIGVMCCNAFLLKIVDKILVLYNEYIFGKASGFVNVCKNCIKKFVEVCKKCIFFVVEFYKKDKKRAIIYFIVLYVVYKIIFGVCYKIGTLFQSHKNEMIVSVREVKPEIVKKTVNCYGYLESENTLQYVSEVRGNIDEILVQEKQYVRAGQLLMVLDSKFTANAYTSAKSILESKKFQYNAIKKLYEDGLESKGNLKAMEADLENANSNFESAKKAYNGLMIHAPFDGYIDNINNKEGAQVNPGTKLFTIERMNAMQVKCEVQNLSTKEVNVGDNVRIFISGYEIADGKIAVIGDSIDVYTGSRSIVVNKIKEKDGVNDMIRPGMSVMMKIEAQSQQNAYKISSEALEATDTGAFMVKVLKPENGEVFAKNIWIYDEKDGVNYVFGLNDNDYVVERGHEFIDVGEKNVRYIKINETGDKTGKISWHNLYVGAKAGVVGFVNFFKNLPEFYDWSKKYYADKINKALAKIKELEAEMVNSINNHININRSNN